MLTFQTANWSAGVAQFSKSRVFHIFNFYSENNIYSTDGSCAADSTEPSAANLSEPVDTTQSLHQSPPCKRELPTNSDQPLACSQSYYPLRSSFVYDSSMKPKIHEERSSTQKQHFMPIDLSKKREKPYKESPG